MVRLREVGRGTATPILHDLAGRAPRKGCCKRQHICTHSKPAPSAVAHCIHFSGAPPPEDTSGPIREKAVLWVREVNVQPPTIRYGLRRLMDAGSAGSRQV